MTFCATSIFTATVHQPKWRRCYTHKTRHSYVNHWQIKYSIDVFKIIFQSDLKIFQGTSWQIYAYASCEALCSLVTPPEHNIKQSFYGCLIFRTDVSPTTYIGRATLMDESTGSWLYLSSFGRVVRLLYPIVATSPTVKCQKVTKKVGSFCSLCLTCLSLRERNLCVFEKVCKIWRFRNCHLLYYSWKLTVICLDGRKFSSS